MTERPGYFAIFGSMRTGSNLLERTLGLLPDVVAEGELFNPSFIGRPKIKTRDGWTCSMREGDPVGFLETIRAANAGKLTGLRIFDGHDRRAMAHMLADPGCARIVLTRDPIESWVSLAIARETDQWILRDPMRRVTTRVRFDPEAFEAYRDRLARHYRWLETEMAEAGTGALHIDYQELHDPEVMARVAEHIGSAHYPERTAPIHRQNPEPMSAKVVNYAEMIDWLGEERPEWRAPERPPVSSADLLIGRHAPLALVPLPGAGMRSAAALMHRIEATRYGAPSEAPARLVERAFAGEVFRSGLGGEALAEAMAGRAVFTFIRHPLARLHTAFLHDVFGPGWQQNPVRRELVARIGPLPSLFMLSRDRSPDLAKSGFPPAREAEALAAYLDIAEGAMAGNGPFEMRTLWLSQVRLIGHWLEIVPQLEPGRYEAFEDFVARLTARIGVDPLPPGQIHAMRMQSQIAQLPALRAITPELEERVGAAYAEDYAELGYGRLTPEMEDPRAAA